MSTEKIKPPANLIAAAMSKWLIPEIKKMDKKELESKVKGA